MHCVVVENIHTPSTVGLMICPTPQTLWKIQLSKWSVMGEDGPLWGKNKFNVTFVYEQRGYLPIHLQNYFESDS